MKLNLRKAIPAVLLFAAGISTTTMAQYPTTCTGLGSRTNGNGQASTCPNVGGTPYASNFLGTIYAIVPITAKTGTLVFRYPGAAATLKPLAITSVWTTNPVTLPLLVGVGPASVATVVGGNVEVTYCFYGTNLPNAGTLSFLFSNPETGLPVSICSYAANCASNCTITANPAGLTLPVHLSSFTAINKKNTAELQWSTAQESNNKGFSIQRSYDGTNFSTLAFVASKNANGNSSVSTAYSFTDQQPGNAKTIWYRLQQEDFDGKQSASSVVSVRFNTTKTGFRVFGGNNSIHIVGNGIIQGDQFQIKAYDVTGRIVYAGTMLSNKEAVIPTLAKGTYYVRLQSAKGVNKEVFTVSVN